MLPSPDSAETAKTTALFRVWAAVLLADITANDESNSIAREILFQLDFSKRFSILTQDSPYRDQNERDRIIHCQAGRRSGN
jgi:hypothetical protein